MIPQKNTFTDRLTAAADARKAMLAKFKPLPTRTAEAPIDRQAEREAELAAVRQARADARAAQTQALIDAENARRELAANQEQEALDAKRANTKARKAMTEAEAKAKRDAKYAARQARRR
jgi:hypothetical protein